jgi:hypothetical protein
LHEKDRYKNHTVFTENSTSSPVKHNSSPNNIQKIHNTNNEQGSAMNASFDSFNSFNSVNQFNQFNPQYQNMNMNMNMNTSTNPQHQTLLYPYDPATDLSLYPAARMDEPFLPTYYDLQPPNHASMAAYHKQVPATSKTYHKHASDMSTTYHKQPYDMSTTYHNQAPAMSTAYHPQAPAMSTTYHKQYYNPDAASGYPVARAHGYGGTAASVSSRTQYHPSPAVGFVGSGNHGYQMAAWTGSVKPQYLGSEYQLSATTTAPVVGSGSAFIHPYLSAPSHPHSSIVQTPLPPPPPPAAEPVGYQSATIDLTLDDDNQDKETPAESGTIVPPSDQQLPNEATAALSTTEVAPKPAEPKPVFRKRTYAWLTPSAPVGDMPNAKRSKLSDWDLQVRGLAECRARNTTALHFLNGPPAANSADVVTPMPWAVAVANITAPGGVAEELGLKKPPPKKARGKKDGTPVAAAGPAKKKAVEEGAKKKGKAPATKKDELKEKMRSKKEAWKKGKVVKEAVVEREAEEDDDSDGLVDLIEGAFDDDVDVNTTNCVVDGATQARAEAEEDDDDLVDLIEGAFDDDDVNNTTSVVNGVVAEKGVVEERVRVDEQNDGDNLVDQIEGAFDEVVDVNPINSAVDEVVVQKGARDKEDEEQTAGIDDLFESDEEQTAGIDDLFESDEEGDSGELIIDENPLTIGEKQKLGLM